MLLGSAAASSWINAEFARIENSNQWYHAAVPGVVLVTLVLFELSVLSKLPRAYRWISLLGLGVVAGISLVQSYLAILEVILRWTPSSPFAVNAAAAAVPDVVMTVCTVLLIGLRVKRDGSDTPSREPSRLRLLAAKAQDRALSSVERRLEPPPNLPVEGRVEAPAPSPASPSEPPLAAPVEEVREAPAPVPTLPVERPVEPEDDLPPPSDAAMEEAEQLLHSGEAPKIDRANLARIIDGINAGHSTNRLKKDGLGGAGTIDKVRRLMDNRREDIPAALSLVNG
ncbi:hypothetical protein BST28_17500 [Mycolicibacter kumamotonensis]|uniref:DUF2637 domain-containing protein n=1 Tax=Mycolicibacter kumamotonensis TaxID=354243 RepID=A0A1X0DZI7_9MYCO|nr:hypothetical protein BST28_17500 [Mycolicibacter kumamotonensis]